LKKYSPKSLLNLVNEDVLERFQQTLYILILLLLLLHDNEWVMSTAIIERVFSLWLIFVVSEMFVDWLKHSFITEKGNERKGYRLYDAFAQHLISKNKNY